MGRARLPLGACALTLDEVGPEHEPLLRQAIKQSLAALAAADGSVHLGGSVWVVTAKN